MPTILRTITNVNDIAQEVNAAGDVQVNFGSVSNNVDIINDEWFALRFLDIAVPQGAILLAVRLAVTINTSTLDEPFHNWYAQAIDDAPAFTAGAANFDISSRSRTTAFSLWDVPDLGVGSIATRFQVPGMLSVIQEIINRPGWASGNAIVLIVTPASADSTRDLVFTTVITNPSFVPILEIEYELPGFISAGWTGAIQDFN